MTPPWSKSGAMMMIASAKPPDHTLDDPIFRLGVTDRDEPIDRIEAVGKLVAQSADVVTQGEQR